MLDYESLIPKSFSAEDRYNLLEIIKTNSRAYQEEIKTDDYYLSLNNKIISDIIYWYIHLFDCRQIVKTIPVYTPVSISPYTKTDILMKTRKSEHFIDIDSDIIKFIKENINEEHQLLKEEEMIFDYIRNLTVNNIKFDIYFPNMTLMEGTFTPKYGDFNIEYFKDNINMLNIKINHIGHLPLNTDEILIRYISDKPSVVFYPYMYLLSYIKNKNSHAEFKHLCRYHIEKTKWFDGSFDLIRLKK